MLVSYPWDRLRPRQQQHYRPPEAAPFQRKLAHRLDLHGILDLRQHPSTIIKICPGFASSHNREAPLDTVPTVAAIPLAATPVKG